MILTCSLFLAADSSAFGRDVVELTELFRLLLDADVYKEELLDLFEIAVVLFAGGAGGTELVNVDAGIDASTSLVVEETEAFDVGMCPTW